MFQPFQVLFEPEEALSRCGLPLLSAPDGCDRTIFEYPHWEPMRLAVNGFIDNWNVISSDVQDLLCGPTEVPIYMNGRIQAELYIFNIIHIYLTYLIVAICAAASSCWKNRLMWISSIIQKCVNIKILLVKMLSKDGIVCIPT